MGDAECTCTPPPQYEGPCSWCDVHGLPSVAWTQGCEHGIRSEREFHRATAPAEPSAVADALRELRILTRCTCQSPYPLVSGRHDLHCLEEYREEVETLAAALGHATEETEEKNDG